MTPRSTSSSCRPSRTASLVGAFLLLVAGSAAGEGAPAAPAAPPAGRGTVLAGPPADTAVIATIDGTPVTAGQVREIMRVTGAGAAGAGAALDRAIESQLLYAEGARRGLREDPQVVADIGRDTSRLLIDQYVLWKYPDEIRPKDPGSFHQGARMRGSHGGMMSEAALLGDMVEKLEKDAGARAKVTLVPEAYQKPNTTGGPRGRLVVARLGEKDTVTWDEVEAMDRGVAGLDPPLAGVTALRFVRTISRAAGHKLLLQEAEAAIPAFREPYDRARERLARASVIRRLLAAEVEASVNPTEADVRAYYDANPGRYGSAASPSPFEQVRAKVAQDARRDAVARARAAYVAKLRGAAAVVLDQPLLDSLGK